MFQGDDADEGRNGEAFPFDPGTIDAVVLSHAHIDHSGRLPLLVRRGYVGPVFTHAATADLCGVMLRDSAFLQEKEAEWRRRRGANDAEPLYTQADAAAVERRIEPVEYDRWIQIASGVRCRLHDAGHILGSAIVEIEVDEGGARRTLVFSGDLGHRGAPILRDPVVLRRADLVVMESTYGDREHRSWSSTWKELGDILSEARADKGNILIPAFAVGRTQELLYVLRRHFDEWGIGEWRIFLDSPMAIRTTRIYQDYANVHDHEARNERRESGPLLDLDNLHLNETTEQSMAINKVTSGAIIIAGSGMCTGGRIRHHLKNNVGRRQCHVVIVGFQAARTTGRALVDGARTIRLMGRAYDVRAKVHTVGGLSAHADQRGLLDWYRGFENSPRVALVHGEERAMDALAARIGESPGGANVFRPRTGSRIEF